MSCSNLTVSEFIGKQDQQRQKYSSANSTMAYDSIKSRSLTQVAHMIQRAFPNLRVVLNDDSTSALKQPAYISSDGRIYLNRDRYQPLSAIHELGHVFMLTALTDPEMKPFYDNIMRLADKHFNAKSDVYYRVLGQQGYQTEDRMKQEIANEVLTYRYNAMDRSAIEDIPTVKGFWNKVIGKFLRALGLYTRKQINNVNYDDVYSWMNVFDRFLYDVINGNVQSGVTELQLKELMSSVNAEMLAHGTNNDKIKDISQLDSILMDFGTHAEVASQKIERFWENKIRDSLIMDSKATIHTPPKDYDIDVTGFSDAQKESALTALAKEIAHDNMINKREIVSNLLGWFNGEFLTKEDEGDILKISDEMLLEKFKGYINRNTLQDMFMHTGFTIFSGQAFTRVYRMDDFLKRGDNAKMLPGMEKMIGGNPFVYVHGMVKKGGAEVGYDMSIIDFTIDSEHISQNSFPGKRLFAKFIDDVILKANKFNIEANHIGLKTFEMGMQHIKIKTINPENNIRQHGVVQLMPDKVKAWMFDIDKFVYNLGALKEINENVQEDVLNKLPDDVIDIITNPATYTNDYSQDVMQTALNWMYDNSEFLRKYSNESPLLEDMITKIKRFREHPGDWGLMEEIFEIRRKYLMEMKSDRPRNYAEARFNTELQAISQALMLIKNKSKSKGSPITGIPSFITPIVSVSDPLISTFNNEIRSTNHEIQRMSAIALERYHELYRTWGKKTRRSLDIRPDKLYKQHFLTFDQIGKTVHYSKSYGKVPEVWSQMIAHKKEHMKFNNLTEADIEFGAGVVSIMNDIAKDYIKHYLKSQTDIKEISVLKDGIRQIDEEKLDRKAEELRRTYWPDGTMPTMPMSPSELFSLGKIRKGLLSFFKRQGKDDVVRTEAIELFEKMDNKMGGDIQSPFGNQIMNESFRQQLVGVIGTSEGLMYTDDRKGKIDFTYDLETLVVNFADDIYFKIQYENRVAPTYIEAKIAAVDDHMKRGVESDFRVEKLKTMYNKHAKGEIKRIFGEGKYSEMFERTVRTSLRFTALLGTGLNTSVALISLTANNMGLIFKVLSNSMAGNPYNMFGMEEFVKARAFVVKNMKLTEKLMGEYQIWDRERENFKDDYRFRIGQKDYYKMKIFQFMNWGIDYATRAEIMIAQMMYEGSLEAHSIKNGKLVYDAKKDRRFFNPNGTQTDAQRLLMENNINILKRELGINQNDDILPVKAYNLKDQERFGFIAREIIGTYAKMEKSIEASNVLFSMVGQFKNYLWNVIDSRMSTNKPIPDAGWHEVVYDDKGTAIGVEYKNFEREGTWLTVAKAGLNDIGMIPGLRKFIHAGRKPSLTKWSKLTKMQKFAFYRTWMDAMSIALSIILYNILQADAGDDEEAWSKALRRSRFMRVWVDGLSTYASATPYELWRMAGYNGSVIPLFNTYSSMMNLITFNPSSRDIRRVTPAYSTIQTATQLSDIMTDNFDNNKE